MKCINCNQELYGGSNVCKNCGTVNEQYVNNSAEVASVASTQAPVFSGAIDQGATGLNNNLDSRLAIEFIGANADVILPRMRARKPNVWAYLFGPFYFMYRKMYLVGILEYILCVLLPLPGLVVSAIYSFTFYGFYNKHVNTSINILKAERNGCSDSDLVNKARTMGGTSILAPILFFVGIFILAFVLVAFKVSLTTLL